MDINKKQILSILSIVTLVSSIFLSFTVTAGDPSLESPLYDIRTEKAIQDNDINQDSSYIGMDEGDENIDYGGASGSSTSGVGSQTMAITCSGWTCDTDTCGGAYTCYLTCDGFTCDSDTCNGAQTCGITCDGATCDSYTCGDSDTCYITCDHFTCDTTCIGETCHGYTCVSATCDGGATCQGPTCDTETCVGPTCLYTCPGMETCAGVTCDTETCSGWTCTGLTCSDTCALTCDGWTCNQDCDTTGVTCGWTCDGFTCESTCDGSDTCAITCDGFTCQDTCAITCGSTCGVTCNGLTCSYDTCGYTCNGLTCGLICSENSESDNNLLQQEQISAQESQSQYFTIGPTSCSSPTLCDQSACKTTDWQCPTFGPVTCSGPTICMPSECETYSATCDGFTCSGSICDNEQENVNNIPVQQMSSPIDRFKCLTYGPVCLFETMACSTLYPTSCSACVTVGSTCGFTCGEIYNNNIVISSQLEIQNSAADI